MVFYGSQTGTAEGLAKKTAKEAEKRGFAPRLVDMAKYETVDLSKEQNVLVITSTYGDGDPPDNAQAFWNFLQSETAPPLAHLNYSVLALGDTNYSAFCQFGKNCDERPAGSPRSAAGCTSAGGLRCGLRGPAKSVDDGVFAALDRPSRKPRRSRRSFRRRPPAKRRSGESGGSARLVKEESFSRAVARQPSAQCRGIGQGSAAL